MTHVLNAVPLHAAPLTRASPDALVASRWWWPGVLWWPRLGTGGAAA